MLGTNLGNDWDWLQLDPKNWNQDEQYLEMEEFVRHLKVTNDAAERGIGTITDYSKILTKNHKLKIKMLQGVEMSRKIHPDQKKKTLNNNTRW